MSFYKKQVKHCMRGDYNEWRNSKYYTTFDVIDKDCMPEIGDKHGSEVLIAIDELEVDPDDQIRDSERNYHYFKLTYKETDPANDDVDDDDLISHEYVAYDDPGYFMPGNWREFRLNNVAEVKEFQPDKNSKYVDNHGEEITGEELHERIHNSDYDYMDFIGEWLEIQKEKWED